MIHFLISLKKTILNFIKQLSFRNDLSHDFFLRYLKLSDNFFQLPYSSLNSNTCILYPNLEVNQHFIRNFFPNSHPEFKELFQKII
jgi:hypothetical protein